MKYILERNGLPLTPIEGESLPDALLASGFFKVHAVEYFFDSTLWEFSDANPTTKYARIELPVGVSEEEELASWVLHEPAFGLYCKMEAGSHADGGS